MSALASVNRFIGLFVDSLARLFSGRIWALLAGYFVVQAFLLYAFYDFTSPLFYAPVRWWISLFGDQAAIGFTHYPGQFRLLPYFSGWAKFYVGLLLEGLVLGLVARQFALYFVGEERLPENRPKVSAKLWLNLSLGWLVINGLIVIAATLLPDLLQNQIMGHPRRELLFEFLLLPSLFVVITALFLFVIPIQIVQGIGFLRAVSRSFRLFLENPINTLFMSGLILSGPILVSFVTSRPSVIVERFRPEMVFWVLLAGLAMEMVANFLWMGSTVKFLSDEEI
ncbi:MAG: hypothetical protein P1R58_02220 [bacterium]|nr:hypothetical protein [bacterium]